MKRFLCAGVLVLCTAATCSAQDIPLSKILVEGEGWMVAAKDLPGITCFEAEPNGAILIYQSKLTARLKPNGQLEPESDQLITKLMPNIVASSSHRIYVTNLKTKQVIVTEGAEKRTTHSVEALTDPNCLALWPDDGQLVIGDAGGKYLWTARIEKDGTLGGLDRYYSLGIKPGERISGVKAMVMDASFLLYAATQLGVQVFDPTGRLAGVILPPAKEEMTAITLGGKDSNTLFVACGDKIYSRKIQGKAAYTLKKNK